jgi:hypothetical protein
MLRTSLKPLLIGAAAGLILGILLGMLLFWQVWPVKWTNASSYDLAPASKAEYVALVADSSALDRDYTRAAKLLEFWTVEEKQQAFADAIKAYEAAGLTDKAQNVRDLALILQIPSGPLTTPTNPPGLLDRMRVPCLVFVLVLLALVLAVLGLRLLAKRRTAGKNSLPEEAGRPVRPKADVAAAGDVGPAAASGHWITTYKMGESAYDESFPIETASGEYLGECGVGISELLSVPDLVTAFEVWLFDKSDIRTVTRVLLSEHAFHDDALRAKLAAKGEVMLAEVGAPLVLDTSNLQVQAKVTELQYTTTGEQPPNSVFSKLTIELMLATKEGAGEPEVV